MTHNKGFETLCIQDHFGLESGVRPHLPPIYATSTFVYESAEKAMDVFQGKEQAYIYSRWDNPSYTLIEEKVAALEAFGLDLKPKALLFSSGMAAISSFILSLKLKPGDAILTQGNLYGTTTELLYNVIAGTGVSIIYADLKDLNKVADLLQSNGNIKLLYLESPNNPTLECYDLEALAILAKQHHIITAIDNTFATPYLQQPFRFGIDYILHSTTKFLNGHGTALGGMVVGLDRQHMEKEVWRMRKLLGGTASPFDAFLLNNGIKTLVLRMEKHCENANKVAAYLEKHTAVARVNHNSLPSHPDHELAKRQMRHFVSTMSFELKGGLQAGIRMMDKVKLCILTASIGTVDTLIQHPASMTHSNVPLEQRLQYGITDGLIRLSVGLENVEDIIADLQQAMDGL
ncbi:MAG: aminotransferase class I/II-fold pyridoxal phosphate-dependent enzyme [Chitinophagales bacterium]|nr:aminotransferase class I/II-fold pyridoxal phosphate-dependent enzyme [Chitinophagales bacterium]